MKIIFILEDFSGGVDLKCMRLDVGDTASTPANRLALELEQTLFARVLSDREALLKSKESAQCLH
jgi:hypothetical protein